jgi:glycosyltransferase involved in cell wall biosynthesis
VPRLLLVTPAELTRDPRARRAAEAAKSLGFGVVGLSGRISGESPAELADVVVVRVGAEGRTNMQWKTGGDAKLDPPVVRELRGLYRLARLGARTASLLRAGRTLGGVDVIHANDLDTLPAAYLLARESRSRLVYDAHELYADFDPEPPRLARALLNWMERLLARRADAVVTVSNPIAHELTRRLGVEPIVVLNAPATDEREPPDPGDDGPLRVVYQGAFGTGRPLADLVEILRNAPSVILTLRVSRSSRMELGRALPSDLDARVEVADPVDPAHVVGALYGHHVGLLFDRPLTRNAELSSPNKLFEYLMAGLAVVAPRLPGLLWVEEERLGLLAEPCAPERIGKALERLAGDRALVRDLRGNARAAARARYNAEAQIGALARAWTGPSLPLHTDVDGPET